MTGLRLLLSLSLVGLTGCIAVKEVHSEIVRTQELLTKIESYHGSACAPVEYAHAIADANYAEAAIADGFTHDAAKYAAMANASAWEAWEKSEVCGRQDTDGDKIPDIIDQCPEEAEDYDGEQDTDGCRDVDPYADPDADGIRNIDDACIDEPEDFDGHNDEDGCPETSADVDGDNLIDAVDECPNEAEDLDGFRDSDGCPDYDNDNDTLPDLRDMCPNSPEDLDSWEDEDGCPDQDNDLDGISDLDDQCPNEFGLAAKDGCPSQDADGDGIADANDMCPNGAETQNGYLDSDGCPDTAPRLVKVTRTRIEITMPVNFATGSANLLNSAYEVLDDVVAVLRDADDMSIRVEGHTDAEGNADSNQRLSERRAESVTAYLISQGISANRLEARGYGATQPIDTNRTASGRANNRRVEFHIVQ